MTALFYVLVGAATGALLCSLIMARRLAFQRSRAELLFEQRGDLETAIDGARTELQEARREQGEADRRVAAVEERLRVREEQIAERESVVEDLQRQLPERFQAMGLKTLEQSSKHFMEMATKALEPLVADTKGDLAKRQQAVEGLVKPILEQMERQQKAIRDLEKQRVDAYRGLDERVVGLLEAQKDMGRETGRLVKALRKPSQRGRWGEMQLRNVVSQAGMTERCDFEEQVSVSTDQGVSRPDMVVKLPGDGLIVVDSKVALDAYLDATEAEADVEAHLARHADQVETHYRALAAKEYWRQFERAPKFVVMFMPIESALVSALQRKPDLLERAMASQVLIVTPTTLLGLLLSAAHGWQREDIAENARHIGLAGKELHERIGKVVGHFRRLGKHLDQTVNAFNATVGSIDSRVLPSARRLRELGATTEPEIESSSEIDLRPRDPRSRTDESDEDLPGETERGAA